MPIGFPEKVVQGSKSMDIIVNGRRLLRLKCFFVQFLPVIILKIYYKSVKIAYLKLLNKLSRKTLHHNLPAYRSLLKNVFIFIESFHNKAASTLLP